MKYKVEFEMDFTGEKRTAELFALDDQAPLDATNFGLEGVAKVLRAELIVEKKKGKSK
jgi:hypothetical protein